MAGQRVARFRVVLQFIVSHVSHVQFMYLLQNNVHNSSWEPLHEFNMLDCTHGNTKVDKVDEFS